jgi:hypothetical protein
MILNLFEAGFDHVNVYVGFLGRVGLRRLRGG